ncbi:hypothetical protein [Acinetobacter nosocomialis]|uniref:hypothetical protein n=1 Tax=Acinetobacter nosocomialis TaxID=106654 RepID=UPI001F22E022|nr:hypothetical protein [Acinetobacter nosocomialis]MCE7534217.1 hypothetical protein [Acinetobacter nosocomialis]
MKLANGNVSKSFALENTSEAAEQIVQFADSLSANILIVGKIQTGKTLICKEITDQHFEHKPALPDKPFEFNVSSQQQENGFVALDDTFSFSDDRIKEFLEYINKNKLRFIFTAIGAGNIRESIFEYIDKHHNYIVIEIE